MKFTSPKTRAEQDAAQTPPTEDWAALEAATAPDPQPEPTVETPPVMPVATAPPVVLTQDQFAALLSAIGGTGGGGITADDMRAVMHQARKPIPENEVHSGISHYRPQGMAGGTPAFRWPEVWFAAMDDKGDAHPLHPFDVDRCTVEEIDAINSLIPGVRGKVRFMDGSPNDACVIEERTTGGEVKRLLIGFNFAVWKDRNRYNSIGLIPQLCAQLRDLATVAA